MRVTASIDLKIIPLNFNLVYFSQIKYIAINRVLDGPLKALYTAIHCTLHVTFTHAHTHSYTDADPAM